MITHQKLGQRDLLYGSKSPADKSGSKYTASFSDLSVTVCGLIVVV